MKSVNVNDDLNASLLIRWRGMTDKNLHSEVRAEIGAFFAERMDDAELKAAAAELAAIVEEHKCVGHSSVDLVLRRKHAFNRVLKCAGQVWPYAVELAYKTSL